MGARTSVFREANTTIKGENPAEMKEKRQVAIVGGGPGGMAAAKVLQRHGFDITVFEEQDGFGGVWKYTGRGPMYRDLNTNITAKLMEYADCPFEGSQGYRDREDVYNYVVKYSTGIGVTVKFRTKITQVHKENDKWKLIDSNGEQWVADFLVVATGHYNFPYTPAIKGIAEWEAVNPGTILHSRHFDNPDSFAGKRVLIVGNAASGLDLAIQILGVTAPVTVCRRHEAPSDELFDGKNMRLRPEIDFVDGKSHNVYFIDGTSEEYDVILFCTGYLYSYPFLEQYSEEQQPHPLLHPKRLRLCNMYRRTFYLADPTLAVIGMEKNIVPMPVSETQAAAVARVFSRELELPSKEEMLRLEEEAVKERGDGQGYHVLGYPKDVAWMDELDDWVQTAIPRHGFYAEKWDDGKRKMREASGRNKLGEFKDKIDQSNRKREGKQMQ